MGEEIKDKINKIKKDVDALPTVGFGDYVLHDHHNEIIDVFKELAELLQSLPKKKYVTPATLEVRRGATVEIVKTPQTNLTLEVRRGATVEIVKTPQTNLTHEETIS